MRKLLTLFSCFIFLTTTANEPSPADSSKIIRDTAVEQEPTHLTIGIKHLPPFVITKDGEEPRGLSITLWENIVDNTNYTFEYKEYKSLDKLMQGVENAEVDISISPITVTKERYEKFDFSQPFFVTGTTYAKRSSNMVWDFIKNIVSWQFFTALSGLLFILLLFGFFIWIFEHKKNDHFHESPLKGIGHGFWWSTVTMTTVGYGDKVPVTFWGRFVSFIWMFTAVIIISSLTAGIASSLTVQSLDSNIQTVRDLRGKNVGTVQHSSSAAFLDVYNVEARMFQKPENGLISLKNGEIDIFVYDKPVIKYLLQENKSFSDINVVENIQFKTDYYSFSFPKGKSSLIKQINTLLIDELNSVEWVMEVEDIE